MQIHPEVLKRHQTSRTQTARPCSPSRHFGASSSGRPASLQLVRAHLLMSPPAWVNPATSDPVSSSSSPTHPGPSPPPPVALLPPCDKPPVTRLEATSISSGHPPQGRRVVKPPVGFRFPESKLQMPPRPRVPCHLALLCPPAGLPPDSHLGAHLWTALLFLSVLALAFPRVLAVGLPGQGHRAVGSLPGLARVHLSELNSYHFLQDAFLTPVPSSLCPCCSSLIDLFGHTHVDPK